MLIAQSHLAANLEALGERNGELAERLGAAAPHPGFTTSETDEDAISAAVDGRPLCSRRRPLEEAARLAAGIDLVEHAVVVVLGFGLGYHVRELARRADKATVIIVFEPDLALLRAVFEQIDHARWMRDALLVFITDPADRGALARKLEGAESILAQGVEFIEHPPSRPRLGGAAKQFANLFSEHVAAAKTTLATTLMRSADTVRNLLLNLDHYAAGAGVADLKEAARGSAAVIVSAGPSLHRNMDLLSRDGVRDRCLIIAVQTALKPLLKAGIRPHFITALDYHEISRRFYEDLDPGQLRDVTLIADPKVNPVVLDLYPGPVRCCGNGFLDKLLGQLGERDMGALPAGATVAHLALYAARYLGCNPIALIGQDLGFTDGLYYAPGAVIHEVWAPELNSFNTIAMMEWQRIARHRLHLHKTTDARGKSIYTDAQMQAYLHQFERDFSGYSREGITIVDATEGGVPKQHTVAMPLQEFLASHARQRLPDLSLACRDLDGRRLREAAKQVARVRRDVVSLKDISRDTQALIGSILDETLDQRAVAERFGRIDENRRKVEQRFEAFELINHMNQLGVFKRLKADRRLHMRREGDARARQRAQLERDLVNVTWVADAAAELARQLEVSEGLLGGRTQEQRSSKTAQQPSSSTAASATSISALIPIDLKRHGDSVTAQFQGRSAIQATLERLGQSHTIQSIILIVAAGDDVDSLIDRARIGLPVEIERCKGSPFGPEHEAIDAARAWSRTCWRGGLGGMSIYDEVLCPRAMSEVMSRRGLDAALLVGPDWPLLEVGAEQGCDAVVRRYRSNPTQHTLVFTQAPPGLCGCVISASLMRELAQRNRLSTVGALLVYQPHAPQHDPIAREANVQIDHRIRGALVRATFDTPRQRALLNQALQGRPAQHTSTCDILDAIAQREIADEAQLPEQIVLELCTERGSRAAFARSLGHPCVRPPLPVELAQRIFDELIGSPDAVLTLAGAGDPLLHPGVFDIIARAKAAGLRAVRVRTELQCPGADRSALDKLLSCGVDVISVDLNADRAATYQAVMGLDGFKQVLLNMEYLLQHRRRLTDQPGTAAFALPWVVPHLQRSASTYEDIDSFFDRWQRTLGTAVIEDPPTDREGKHFSELIPARMPARVAARQRMRGITILCDGSAPLDWWDFSGQSESAGTIAQTPMIELWRRILAHWRS